MPDRAPERAKTLDVGLEKLLASISLPPRRQAIAEVRTYLQRQDADMGHRNNVLGILRIKTSRNEVFITVGPEFDKGPTDSHFHLESGSRLSFGITLSETNQGCSLVAYRFQLNLPEARSPSFYRFDLNREAHQTPLLEPRCHFHPGAKDIRIPCLPLTPLEVLDRIFLVIEPQLL